MKVQVDIIKKKKKQTINRNKVKTLCKENSWLWNDNQ